MKQKSISLKEAFNMFRAASAKGKRKKQNGSMVSPRVLTNYQHVQNGITQFEAYSQKTYEIQFVTTANPARWQQAKRYWKGFLDNYLQYARNNMHWTDSYLRHNLTVIKAVFNYLVQARGLPIGNFQKDFMVPVWQPQPLVIMPQRLQWLIENTAFRKSLSPCLQKVLDTMVIGCTVGLRYKDLMALRPVHIEVNPACTYLKTTTSKTGTPVLIPMPPYAVTILQRYYGSKSRWLLPQLSNNQFNKQMKCIGKLAGWAKVPKYRSAKGKQTEIKNKSGKSWKFYEHLSAHTMRRTAITTLLLMGVDEAVVRTISGHAPASKEFFRYVAFVQGYLDKQVKRAHQLLLEHPTCYLDM